MARDEQNAGPDGADGPRTGAGGLSSGGSPRQVDNASPGQQAKGDPKAAEKSQKEASDPSLASKAAVGGAGAVAGGKLASASEGAGKMDVAKGAFKGADVATKAQSMKNDPNLTNAVKLAGTVDKRLAVAGAVMEGGKKVHEKGKDLTDTTREGLDEAKSETKGDKDSKEDSPKEPERGAGGTSAKRQAKDDDNAVGTGKGAKAAVAGGAAAGSTAAPILFVMMIINWLKTFFMAVMQAVMGWLAGLIAMIANAVMAVVGFFVGIGTAISGFLGGAISATAAAASSFLAFVTAAVMVVAVAVGGVNADTNARRDGLMQNCVSNVAALTAESDVANQTSDAQTEANAKRVYAILGGMGMSDVNIAGILGNWTAESGVDPTGVETVFGEQFHLGPKKLAAQAVDFRIDDYNPSYGAQFPAIVYAGIGLGQWTNDRNTMLRQYSSSIGKQWQEIDTQLGFMVSKDDPARVNYIKQLIQTQQPSVDAAVRDFMAKWEGLSDGSTGTRLTAAETWYAKFSGWTKDKALADSIIAQSGAAVVAGNGNAVSAALSNCRTAVGVANNSSLALAALSYAWPTREEGVGNNGTPLYQEIHDYVYPGDPYYMSCDRGVASAVRWSGTDDTFPPGAVEQQIGYLSTSPKWVEVPWGGDVTKLQPGDILIRWDGGPPSSAGGGGGVQHIELFVGNELTQQVFAGKVGPQSMMVSASYGTRSPSATNFYTGGSRGLDTYRAFRSTGKEPASKFSSYVPRASSLGNATFPSGGGSSPAPTATMTP